MHANGLERSGKAVSATVICKRRGEESIDWHEIEDKEGRWLKKREKVGDLNTTTKKQTNTLLSKLLRYFKRGLNAKLAALTSAGGCSVSLSSYHVAVSDWLQRLSSAPIHRPVRRWARTCSRIWTLVSLLITFWPAKTGVSTVAIPNGDDEPVRKHRPHPPLLRLLWGRNRSYPVCIRKCGQFIFVAMLVCLCERSLSWGKKTKVLLKVWDHQCWRPPTPQPDEPFTPYFH